MQSPPHPHPLHRALASLPRHHQPSNNELARDSRALGFEGSCAYLFDTHVGQHREGCVKVASRKEGLGLEADEHFNEMQSLLRGDGVSEMQSKRRRRGSNIHPCGSRARASSWRRP